MHYNINIRLFGQVNVEIAEVEQVIHAWLAQPTLLASLQKSYGQ